MLYAREVIALLGAFPGRDFRMGQILAEVSRGKPEFDARGKAAVRKAVSRVLDQLRSDGHVGVTPAMGRGGYALYAWRTKSETRTS